MGVKQLIFDLGQDKHGFQHTITVELSTGLGGVPGLRLHSSRGHMAFTPSSSSEAFVTTLRPDTIPPKDPPPPLEETILDKGA